MPEGLDQVHVQGVEDGPADESSAEPDRERAASQTVRPDAAVLDFGSA